MNDDEIKELLELRRKITKPVLEEETRTLALRREPTKDIKTFHTDQINDNRTLIKAIDKEVIDLKKVKEKLVNTNRVRGSIRGFPDKRQRRIEHLKEKIKMKYSKYPNLDEISLPKNYPRTKEHLINAEAIKNPQNFSSDRPKKPTKPMKVGRTLHGFGTALAGSYAVWKEMKEN